MRWSVHELLVFSVTLVWLAGCDLNLDKSLIEGEPSPSDAAIFDASVDAEAGKDASTDAEAGTLDSSSDEAKTDSSKPDGGSSDASDAAKVDAELDAACVPPQGSNTCMQCAMAHCCPEVNACAQDQQCMVDLLSYLNCTSDAGTECILGLWQSSNAADVTLVKCLSPACGECNQT